MANTQAPAPAAAGSGKAVGAILGGALYTIIVYAISTALHITLPSEVSSAIQTLVVTACVYWTPHNLGSN
jgi:ABC-type branched-subunit amino acid transport system permease subunit